MHRLRISTLERLPVIAALFLISFTASAEALDAWLDKMKQAAESQNYEGTLIIRQQDRLQAMHVQHGVNEQGSWEVLESLSGELRKVIHKNGRVTTVFPNRGLLTISRDQQAAPLHPQLPENYQVLKQHYSIRLAGKDRVARKQAQVVELSPRDEYRYGFRFWLDQDSGLLLKCDLVDEKGGIIEQLMFSELNILDQAPVSEDFSAELEGYQVLDLDQGREQPASQRWQAKHLPNGFMLTQATIKPSVHGEGMVNHMVFSDGMASVSVFIEKRMPEQMALTGVSKMGALNAYGQAVNGYHVTVMGEVPVATVRLIGQSIHPVP